jgi:transposase
MRKGRPTTAISLSSEEKNQLNTIRRSRSLPISIVRRATIILLADDGLSNLEIAAKLDITNSTVGFWRRRFAQYGIQGLHDELRGGRPRSLEDERVAELINTVLHTKPSNATQWSVRTCAQHTGISRSTVHRVFKMFGIQPHRVETFKLSNDPFFVDKVRDIVGLYLNPPDSALVLAVDEKSQIQALNRTQPVLPMGLGYVEGVTHDYIRNGTTTLFAALDIVSGKVIAQCKARHRHQEFLSFLRHIDANVPTDLDVHLIIDNYATHKHPKVRAWLASRPRYHVHYTPTYASWLNQVERWFGIITQQSIRRGSFKSVGELIRNIKNFVENYNKNANPFMWTATADSIFAKITRLLTRISGT